MLSEADPVTPPELDMVTPLEAEEELSQATLIWRAIKLPIYSVALVPLTVSEDDIILPLVSLPVNVSEKLWEIWLICEGYMPLQSCKPIPHDNCKYISQVSEQPSLATLYKFMDDFF